MLLCSAGSEAACRSAGLSWVASSQIVSNDDTEATNEHVGIFSVLPDPKQGGSGEPMWEGVAGSVSPTSTPSLSSASDMTADSPSDLDCSSPYAQPVPFVKQEPAALVAEDTKFCPTSFPKKRGRPKGSKDRARRKTRQLKSEDPVHRGAFSNIRKPEGSFFERLSLLLSMSPSSLAAYTPQVEGAHQWRLHHKLISAAHQESLSEATRHFN